METDKVNWIVRLLKMVLDCNVFEWDKKLYQQLFGTAIGTSCAPPYSGLYMEEVTKKLLLQFRNRNMGRKPEKIIFFRFAYIFLDVIQSTT